MSFLLFFILISLLIVIIYNFNSNDKFINNAIAHNNFTIYGEARVIDGDSIIVNGYEIRLFDIDAPEYKQICTDQNNKKYKCGIESFKYLKKITSKIKIRCNILGRDYYNRYLATCYKKIQILMLSYFLQDGRLYIVTHQNIIL